jgi:serine phosphatase RsbU (regulator of sigma subunit)
MNSVLVIEETGKVIQPSLANLRMNILRSRAYRFSTNPKQVLDEISQLHQSTNLNKKE